MPPLCLKLVWGLDVGFLMGGTGACSLVGRLTPLPLVGGALSLGEIRGGSVAGGGAVFK